MPEERQTQGLLSTGQGGNLPKPKLATGKYYDIAATLFSTGRSGELVDLFITAARDGDYNRIEGFLQRRGEAVVSVDAKDKRTGNTALIWAAKRGHTKIVQLLLKHGADVTLKNYDGKTAVEVASPGIKTLLLDVGGHTGLSIHQRLLQAAWQGNAAVVQQLLAENKVLDINCQNCDGLTPLLLLCRDLQLFERLSTQLHRDYNPVQVLSVLLEHRANIHAADEDGKTCLHYVSQSKADSAKQLAEDLLQHGSQTELRDRQCFTPIHFASQTGNVEVITRLIDGGSEVNARGFAGATPLHYTAYNDHDKAAATLLEHGADILLTDDRGLTALDVARTKKMKSRLREAWTEVVQSRQEVNLAPVRQPTRDESRLSTRGETPDMRVETPHTRRLQGEVLFDGLPLNPFGSSLSSSKRRIVKVTTTAEKALLAEEQMLKDTGHLSPSTMGTREGVRRLGLRRPGSNQKPNPLPLTSKSIEKLPPVKGDLIESVSTKQKTRFNYQRSKTEINRPTKNNKLAKLFTYPRSESRRSGLRLSCASPISVTRLAPDNDEDSRFRRLSQTPNRQCVSRVTPSSQTPIEMRSHSVSSPCLADLASTVNDYLYLSKRRSLSTSSCGQSEDYDTEEDELRFSPKVSPRQISPPGTERNRVKIPAIIEEKRSVSVQGQPLPNLEQMRLTKSVTPVQGEQLYPNSRKVLPPTPVQKSLSSVEKLMNVSEDFKECSPGSSEEFDEAIHLTTRAGLMLKTEFIIEGSRPKDLILQSSGSDSCDSVESNPAKNTTGQTTVASPAKQQNVGAAALPTTSSTKTGTISSSATTNSVVKTNTGTASVPTNSLPKSILKNTGAPPVSVPQTKSKGLLSNGNQRVENCDTDSKRPLSNTDKLKSAARDNAALVKGSSRLASNVSSVSFSFSGTENLIVSGDQKPGLTNEKTARLKNELSKSCSLAPGVSKTTPKSPTKSPLTSSGQKPNSASGRSMAVNPTKLISSMKKRAILRSKQGSTDSANDSKDRLSSGQSKCTSNTSSANKLPQNSQPTTGSSSVGQKNDDNSGNTTDATNSKLNSSSAPDSVSNKTSALPCESVVPSWKGKHEAKPDVTTSSRVNQGSTAGASDIPADSPNKLNNHNGAQAAQAVAQNAKTPLVKIFSTSADPQFSCAPVEIPLVEQTPLIVNPFENFASNMNTMGVRENLLDNGGNSPVKQQRVSSASSRKQVTKTNKVGKGLPVKVKPSATVNVNTKRVTSGRRRGSQTDPKGSEKRPSSNTRAKIRPRSGKRVRSGKGRGKKADKENLGKEAAKSDVALISGIGWHIATSCEDKSDIQAVRLNLDSDSSEDELERVCTPKPLSFRPFSSPSPRFVEVKSQQQQHDLLSMMNSKEIPPMNLDMSRNTIHVTGKLPDPEHPQDTPVKKLVGGEGEEPKENLKVENAAKKFILALPPDLLKCALSPIPESPSVLSRTTSALRHFSQTVPDDMLSDLLGVFPGDPPLSHRSIGEQLANRRSHGVPRLIEPSDQIMVPACARDGTNSDGSDSDDTLVSERSATGEKADSGTRKSLDSKFVEIKKDVNHEEEEENVDEIVEEILSSTGPASLNSTLKSNKSSSSRNSTLTEADVKILKNLQNSDSPFHAKKKKEDADNLREIKDNEGELGGNPDLLKVFHAEDFKVGQRMKAMIDAGADQGQVKAMLQVDSEAKQLERIIHSFRKMELQASANPYERSESPRVRQSSHSPQRGRSSTLENPKRRGDKPPLGRPHSSAGFTSASKARKGRFTEIKDNQQIENFPSVNQGSSITNTNRTDDKVPEKCVSLTLTDNTAKPPEEEGTDSLQRSTSACSSSSTNSIPKSEDTICWKKGNILGRGAFGTVWCGLTGEGELIAVKQIELNTSDMEKANREYEKIQEEVELLKTLTHKNIVGYLGTSFEDNFVSIYMQFVPGGSIASILARFGALEEKVFCLYTKQILEGVEYLHENDVIHRDIKGGNIMLMPTGVIKLIDFGCAKRLCINLSMSRSQILKSMKGTPYWMAPEVVNETGHGRKSDIWSIGCTVFEMATRKPPWSDMSPLAAIFAIGCDKPVPQLPDHFSKDVRDFVNKCLTRDQNERMSASEALQHRFITRRRKSRAV